MDEEISVIIPVRNREARRIERLVESLRVRGADARFIIVDYGSDRVFSESYASIARVMRIDYERMRSDGWPWNKCRAINRGARLARGEHVCTVDVDVFFETNPFPYCLGRGEAKAMFHINTYWLGRDGDIAKARPAGLGGPGGFQFIRRSAFDESGGYDERILYWGQEDMDWPERLKRLGYEMLWLPEPHRIYHQWHPSPERGFLRPATASFDTMRACAENVLEPALDQDWGRPLAVEDRPILDLMERREPTRVRLDANDLMRYGNVVCLLEAGARDGFVKAELGPRLRERPFSSMAGAVRKMIRPLTALTGLDCSPKTNSNFDYAYAMIPVLLRHGLRDYFVTSDLSAIYLYWS